MRHGKLHAFGTASLAGLLDKLLKARDSLAVSSRARGAQQRVSGDPLRFHGLLDSHNDLPRVRIARSDVEERTQGRRDSQPVDGRHVIWTQPPACHVELDPAPD